MRLSRKGVGGPARFGKNQTNQKLTKRCEQKDAVETTTGICAGLSPETNEPAMDHRSIPLDPRDAEHDI